MLILVRRIFNAVGVQICHHAVEFALPHFLEPICVAEPFNKRGADCIIGADKCTTIPSFCKSVVTITAKCPDLRAIIRAVNCGGNIAPAVPFL